MAQGCKSRLRDLLAGESDSIGMVTSGVLSPTLQVPIALALLNADAGLEIGSEVEADVREREFFTK